MNLPTSIRVGYRDYEIHPWPANEAYAASKRGECDNENAIIRVSSALSGYDLLETLDHEILHAVYWIGDIADSDDQERTVTRLATVLTQVWRDNPDYRSFKNGIISDFVRRAEGEIAYKVTEVVAPASPHQWWTLSDLGVAKGLKLAGESRPKEAPSPDGW